MMLFEEIVVARVRGSILRDNHADQKAAEMIVQEPTLRGYPDIAAGTSHSLQTSIARAVEYALSYAWDDDRYWFWRMVVFKIWNENLMVAVSVGSSSPVSHQQPATNWIFPRSFDVARMTSPRALPLR